jgi:hypothetical protein
MQTQTTAPRFGSRKLGAVLAALGLAAVLAIIAAMGLSADMLPGRGDAAGARPSGAAHEASTNPDDHYLFLEENIWTNATGAYPTGVLEATDVALNNATAQAVPFDRPRALFLEQNLVLPGDAGYLDDRVLSTKEIQFLEQNTYLPGGGSQDMQAGPDGFGVTDY